MFAAIPCQQDTRSSVRCEDGCPMMALVGKSSAQSRVVSTNYGRPCCRVSPGVPVSTSTGPTQLGTREIALVGDTIAGFAPTVILCVEEDCTAPDRPSHGRSQSILCTFLI